MDEEVQKYTQPQKSKPLKFYKSKVTPEWNNNEVGAGVNFKMTTIEVPGNLKVTFLYDANYLRDVCDLTFHFKGLIQRYRLVLSHEYILPDDAFEIYKMVVGQFLKTFRAENLGYDIIVYDTFEALLMEATVDTLPKGKFAKGGFIKSNPASEINWYKNAAHAVVSKNPVAETSRKLPGMDTEVDLPCKCITDIQMSVWSAIQHLNDIHKWTREKIADWIDELHDSGVINAEFESWDEEPLDTDQPVE